MRVFKKKLILLVLIAILSLSLVACSNNSGITPAKVDENIAVTELSGVCTATLEGNAVIVSVETNIREDIVFTLSITDKAGEILDELQMVKARDVDPKASFAIQEEWPDVVIGFLVATSDDNDSDGMKKSYGKDFANITYENMVYTNGKNLIVFKSEPLNIR